MFVLASDIQVYGRYRSSVIGALRVTWLALPWSQRCRVSPCTRRATSFPPMLLRRA